jgi:hypothetical protein
LNSATKARFEASLVVMRSSALPALTCLALDEKILKVTCTAFFPATRPDQHNNQPTDRL